MGLLDPPPLTTGAVAPLVADAVSKTAPQDLRAALLTARTTNAFEFVSITANPIVTEAQAFSWSTSLYSPTIVRVDDKQGDTAYPYRMLLTTDHDPNNSPSAGAGGIWVLKAPAITGPWTNDNAGNAMQGAAFRDTTTGSQTETAWPVWEPLSRLWYVFYQQDGVGGGQVTRLAVTPDFITWEVVGTAVQISSAQWPGSGAAHTGYAVVVRRGEGDWVATHLLGSGNYTRYATSYSRDGLSWVTDPVNKTGVMNRQGSDDRRCWPNGGVFRLNGELWATGNRSAYVSGSASGAPLTVAGPINADLNSWVRPPEPCWQPQYAWEAGGAASRTFLDKDGRLYAVVTNGFKIGLAVANFRAEGIIA